MKALTIKQHGDLDQVDYRELSQPTVRPDEVLLEVKAAALNRLDLWVLKGWPGLNLEFPHILGSDGAGRIAEVGSAVSDFEIGQRVVVNPTLSCGSCHNCRIGMDNRCDHFAIFGEHVPGLYAQYQAVPVENLLHIPDEFPFESAAAAALVYVTAWHSLITVGHFRAGESILIIGAGGGVNLACIDVARFAGASTIYVVGSSEEKLALARRQGADVTYHRIEEDWSKAIYKATGRTGVDVVVDNVGAASFRNSLRALRTGGRLLTVGNTSGPKFEFDNRYIFGKHLQIIGTTMGPKQDFEKVMKMIFQGNLNPVIDSILPLSEGKAALHRLKSGQIAGKLVLVPSS